MINIETWAEIRRLFYAEHQSVNAIASALSVHHETVERAIGAERFISKVAALGRSKLERFHPVIADTLERLPKVRATRLYDVLKERGYDGSIYQLRRYLNKIRPEVVTKRVFSKLSFVAGEQAQCDWASCGNISVGRAVRKLSLFVMVLSYSRKIYACFTFDQTFESFAAQHVRAFEAFGGVPRIILYDNLKSAVIERMGRAINFSPQLVEISGYYHFRIEAAAVRAPQTKGRVERAIGYLKTSFLPGRSFRDLKDANTQLTRWIRDVSDIRPWPQDKERGVQEVFEEESLKLLRLPEHPLQIWLSKVVRAVRWPFVRFDGNDYGVPFEYVGKSITLKADSEWVRFVDGDREIIRHPRSFDKRQSFPVPQDESWSRTGIARRKQYLIGVIPEVESLCQLLIDVNEPLRGHLARLYELCSQFGHTRVKKAVIQALERGTPRSESVAHLLTADGPKIPDLPITLPNRKNVKDLIVRSHDLSSYDKLYLNQEPPQGDQ